MRQVMLVVQVIDDDNADYVFDYLCDVAKQYNQGQLDLVAEGDVYPFLDLFVADDLGTVSRP
jgi:hypothetical protein